MSAVEIRPSIEELERPPEKDLQCHFLGCSSRTFRHRPALNMHLAETHGLKDYKAASVKSVNRVFICPVSECSRSKSGSAFKSLKILKQHYKNIHADRKFPCTKCSKRFVAEKDLEAHFTMCGETFTCVICKTPYTTKEGLRLHQRSQHNAAFKYAQEIVAKAKLDAKPDKPVVNIFIIANENDTKSSSSPTTLEGSSYTTSKDPTDQLPKLLPKQSVATGTSSVTQTTQTLISQNTLVESCGTQTDVLQKAVQACSLDLDNDSAKQLSMSSTKKPSRKRGSKRRISNARTSQRDHSAKICRSSNFTGFCDVYSQTSNPYVLNTQYNQPVHTASGVSNRLWEDNPQYPVNIAYDPAPHQYLNEFGTQTFYGGSYQPPMDYNEFGTQTSMSELLHNISNDTEPHAAENITQSLYVSHASDSNQMMQSFGTQTLNQPNHELSFSTDTQPEWRSQSDTSSFGTQTSTAKYTTNTSQTNLTLNFSDPFEPTDSNVLQSTSDFAMQFPFDDLMNFSSQTTQTTSDFTTQLGLGVGTDFADLDCHGGRPATFSQSATQTDLVSLFSSIETQTYNP